MILILLISFIANLMSILMLCLLYLSSIKGLDLYPHNFFGIWIQLLIMTTLIETIVIYFWLKKSLSLDFIKLLLFSLIINSISSALFFAVVFTLGRYV